MVPLARLILHITRYIYIYIFHIYVLSIIVHRYFHKILRASLKHFPLLNSSHVSIFRCTFLYVLLLLFSRLFGFSFQMSHTRFRKIVIILLFSSSFRFLYCCLLVFKLLNKSRRVKTRARLSCVTDGFTFLGSRGKNDASINEACLAATKRYSGNTGTKHSGGV